jgi:nucleotide-binding universal stress UspA family protein
MPFFLSKKITAQITALRVMEYLPLVYVQSQRTMDTILSKYLEESESILKKSIDIGEKKGVRIESKLRKGDAASNILNYSKKEDYDTIIMGRRGTGKLRQLVLGSTSTKVLNHSDCTVVIVK